jgi:hypothetical protein
MLDLADRSGRNAGDLGSGWKTFVNHRAGADDTSVAELNVFQNYRLRANPAVVADFNPPAFHRQLVRRNAFFKAVIAVGDIHVGAEHILVSNFNATARVDHEIAIKIVAASDPNPNSIKILIEWPEPAALGECIVVADFDLTKSTASPASLHSIPLSLLHA